MTADFESKTSHYSLGWTLFFASSTVFVTFIIYIIYKMVISPLSKMKFYEKQGMLISYFPLIGDYKTGIQGLKIHKDSKHHVKTRSVEKPCRACCSNLASDIYIMLYDPALIKDFFLNNENYIKDPVFLELYSGLLGKGLLTSEGNHWKTQRKILSNAFHFEFLKSILPNVQKTAHENLYNIRNRNLNDVNIMDEFQNITGQVIGKAFFGEQLNEYTLDGKPLTLALADLMGQIGILSMTIERHLLGAWIIKKGVFERHRKLMQKVKDFRKTCSDIVEERKKAKAQGREQNKTGKDMLDLLLEYTGEEGKMSDEEIIDQFVTFFLAGMDTTGHLVTIAVYYLNEHPEIKERTSKEIKKHYSPDVTVTIENLNKFEYTMAFLKETLRVMTPVPGMVPRRAVRDHKLKDITIKKGDLLNIDFFYSSYDEKYFEEPNKFDPDRWLNKEKAPEAFAFTPFSAGPRNCIGQHLALNEARIILAEFLTMYDFKFKEGFDLKMDFKFLYEPVDPIMLDLRPKQE